MPRPRGLDRPREPLQRLPAALRMHRRQTEMPRHPGRHLGAAPQPAILGRLLQPRGQGGQQRRGQQAGGPAVPPPLVAERFRTERVVARGQLLHPARHEGQHLGHLEKGPSLRQQPDCLVVPRLGRIPCRPVPRLQFRDREMLDDPRPDPTPEAWSPSLPARIACRNPEATDAISRISYDNREQASRFAHWHEPPGCLQRSPTGVETCQGKPSQRLKTIRIGRFGAGLGRPVWVGLCGTAGQVLGRQMLAAMFIMAMSI